MIQKAASDDPSIHNSILETHLFVIHKSEDSKELTIKDILMLDRTQLKNIVFKFAAKYGMNDSYFTIKLN